LLLEREKEARQLALLEQQLNEVRTVEERLPKDVETLRRELKTLERSATRLQALVSTKRAMAQVRSAELHKAVQCYSEWLGLTLEPVRDDKTRFVFTRLVRAQPLREAYLVLGVDEQGNFVVDECEPAVAVKAPLAVLNETQELSAFMAHVRRLFVAALTQ